MNEFHFDPDNPLVQVGSALSALGGLLAPWWSALFNEFHSAIPPILQLAGFILICVQIRYYWTRSK